MAIVDKQIERTYGHNTNFLAGLGKEIVYHEDEILTPQQILVPKMPICFARGILGRILLNRTLKNIIRIIK